MMTCARPDWTLFRSLNTLGQRAGVPLHRLPRLVAKELGDNSIDVSGSCEYGLVSASDDELEFYVQDAGPGIEGTDEEVAGLFSIGRPLTSTKLFRLPTRGALGNGLRVVAGAVLASGGSLVVSTRGRSLTLVPQDDGTTKFLAVSPWAGEGTRVQVRLGSSLATVEDNLFAWLGVAAQLARQGTDYRGRTSAYWYDPDAFFELLQAAPPDRTVRDVVAEFDGCAGTKATRACGDLGGREANSLDRDEARSVLVAAREISRKVVPDRLGRVGAIDGFSGYARADGTFRSEGHQAPEAEIPFIVEVWARKADRPRVTVCVNRTPASADVWIHRDGRKNRYTMYGCELADGFTATKAAEFELLVNVQSPYMPLTTDDKAPDLTPVANVLMACLEKAVRCANRNEPRDEFRGHTKKAVVLANMDAAIEKVSGGHRHRYSLRQLFYAIRPYLLEEFGEEPDYSVFARIVKDHERELGHDLPGIYRDNRGVIYHPHLRQEIPLGTRTVEQYERPTWTFNKVLYCEKEGFFPILCDAGWPERNDCALLTSKGFATFAVRDLLDLLDQSDEPLTIFCIHDADGPGTLIYQELVEGVRDRCGRPVEVINLGLEPEEAVQMGLTVEPVSRKDSKRVGVADYVPDEWQDWLQENRSELNAMTTPQFLAWLDEKIAPYDVGKVFPPKTVMSERLRAEVERLVRQNITEKVLREAGIDQLVRGEVRRLRAKTAAARGELPRTVHKGVDDDRNQLWSAVVDQVAAELVVQQ
jgi:hypothetical protein